MITMLRGEDKTFVMIALNSYGGEIDLTGKDLIFSVKENINSDVVKFQRKNTSAGGSDSEVKLISGNIYQVSLVRANTVNLENVNNYYEVLADNSVIASGLLRIEKTVSASEILPEEDLSLIYSKEYIASITAAGVENALKESGFSGAISVAHTTGTYTFTSADDEFLAGKTVIKVQRTDGIESDYEHTDTGTIKVRQFDAEGNLYDRAFTIKISIL